MSRGNEVVIGALAGVAGTAAMTLFMKPGLGRYLPSGWRADDFVPQQVIQWLESVAGQPFALSERQESSAAALAHLGYGASMGALYGLLREYAPDLPAAAAGTAWGIAVWGAGYQGWMPLAGVRPATTHQPVTKWPMPIGNHVVFGVVTALAYDAMRSRRSRRRPLATIRF